MSYRYPYGNTEQMNLDWFLKQWEAFKADWAEAEAGIDGSLDAEIAKVEAAMTELYAARDAAAASATAARQSSLDAAAAQVASGNNKTAAQAAETAARGSQQAAAESAQEAQASATGAENSALTATQAANTATQQAAGADAAKGAAEAAQQAAEAAQAAAAQSAGQAGQAATAAGDHADDAADSATLAQQAAQDMSDSVAQITTNKNDISDLKESIIQYEGFVLDAVLAKWKNGYYTTSQDGGSITLSTSSTEPGVCTDFDVTPGDIIAINAGALSSAMRLYVFADSNGLAMSRAAANLNGLYYVIVPANATHIYINNIFSKNADNYYAYKGAGVIKKADLTDGQKNIKILTGILRNSGSGWELISDADHSTLNMASVSVNSSGNIVVNYGFTAKKVLSLVATPDETFAKQYSIGGSVGLDKTTFLIYALPYEIGGQVKYDYANQTWDISYSTFTGVSFDSTTGELTLTHPSIAGAATKDKYNIHVNGRGCNMWAGRVTDTTIKVFFLDSAGAVIKNPTGDLFGYVTRQVNAKQMNANDIVNENGNFWIIGVMEV